MITNIWLKSQPKKKIAYPDCYPFINARNGIILGIFIANKEGTQGSYSIEIISRLEFKP